MIEQFMTASGPGQTVRRSGGIFVAIEGPDGCGKSTLVEKVAAHLRSQCELRVRETREPGGSEFGKHLRAILKNPAMQDETPGDARRMLFEADRMIHDRHLRRWLGENHVVISDRTALVSNHCYAVGEGTDLGVLDTLQRISDSRLIPDLVIFLDATASTCRARIANASPPADTQTEEIDLAERDQGLFDRVHASYADLIRASVMEGSVTTVGGWRLRASSLPVDGATPDELARAVSGIIQYHARWNHVENTRGEETL